MDQRQIARLIVFSVGLFTVCFLAFAGYNIYFQEKMLDDIEKSGVKVMGTIVEKSRSQPSDSSSARPSFVIEVEYNFENNSYRNPYSVTRSWWERLKAKDEVEIILDPSHPSHSIVGEFQGEQIESEGFIPLD